MANDGEPPATWLVLRGECFDTRRDGVFNFQHCWTLRLAPGRRLRAALQLRRWASRALRKVCQPGKRLPDSCPKSREHRHVMPAEWPPR